MTKYIFFILLTSNAIYSMEDVTPETLFQESSSQDRETDTPEKKVAKRKIAEIEKPVEMPWQNLATTDINNEPDEAKYHIKCSDCKAETKSPWGTSKMRHRKKCSQEHGWETKEPKLVYEVIALCPYLDMLDDTGKACKKKYTDPLELAQIARIPELLETHMKTEHSQIHSLLKIKWTKNILKKCVFFRPNPRIDPTEIKKTKNHKRILGRSEMFKNIENTTDSATKSSANK